MAIPELLKLLEQALESAKSAGKPVELDANVATAVLSSLQETNRLQQQLEQLEEQLSLKPTVAKKLSDKIKALELELETTRAASRVLELERKVQRLEAELKQSYATKNFTLKTGLLEIQKRYRQAIEDSEELQELWSEVTLLITEDKDSLPPSLLARKTQLRSSKQFGSQAGHSHTASIDGTGGGAVVEDPLMQQSVQKTVEKLEEAYPGTPTSQALPGGHGAADLLAVNGSPDFLSPMHMPILINNMGPKGAGRPPTGVAAHPVDMQEGDDTPKADTTVRELSSLYVGGSPVAPYLATPARTSNRANPITLFAEAGTELHVSAGELELSTEALYASFEALKGLFMGAGGPVFPKELRSGAGGQGGASPRYEGEGAGGMEQLGAHSSGFAALHASMEQLMRFWAALAASGGSLQQLRGKAQDGSSKEGSGVPDARYFDATAEAVLASIEQLRALYSQLGGSRGGVLPGDNTGATGTQQRGGNAGAAPDAAAFEQPAAALLASVQQLRTLYRSQYNAQVGGSRHGAGGAGRSSGPGTPMSVASGATSIGPFSRAGLFGGSTTGGAAPEWWSRALEAAGAGGDRAVARIPEEGEEWEEYSTEGEESQGEGQGPSGTADGSGQPGGGAAVAGDAAGKKKRKKKKRRKAKPGAGAAAGEGEAGEADAVSTAPPAASRSQQAASKSSESTVPGTNTFMLPGPARTMQAVAAHVRAKHAEFLAAHPEAETVLQAALAACAELQAAQDQALLGAAARAGTPGLHHHHASHASTGMLTPSRKHSLGKEPAGAVAGGAASEGTPAGKSKGSKKKSKKKGAGSNLGPGPTGAIAGEDRGVQPEVGPDGQPASAEAHTEAPAAAGSQPEGSQLNSAQSPQEPSSALEASSPGDVNQPQQQAGAGVQGGEQEQGGVSDGEEVEGGSEEDEEEEGGLMRRLSSVPLTADDHEAEVDELRGIAARHAEHAAALSELVQRLADQHTQAVERADDLEVQLGMADKEVAALRAEVEGLTRLLVDVKVAFAEKDSEAMRLAQRLKRSLVSEGVARDEVEELKRRLAVVAPDEVITEAGFSTHMRKALKELEQQDPMLISPTGTLGAESELPGAPSLGRLNSQRTSGAQAAAAAASPVPKPTAGL